MAFTTDIVAIDLRRYPHNPALLADLSREGYELFNPEGMVFFRKHNRLASQPVTPTPDATPESPATPEIDYDRLAAAMFKPPVAAQEPTADPSALDAAPAE